MYGMYFITGLLWSGVMLMLYQDIRKLVITAVILKRLKWLPNKGILTPNLKKVSKADKSVDHKKMAPLNHTYEIKKMNKAKKIGICNKAGMQPPSGFTPASRNNFI